MIDLQTEIRHSNCSLFVRYVHDIRSYGPMKATCYILGPSSFLGSSDFYRLTGTCLAFLIPSFLFNDFLPRPIFSTHSLPLPISPPPAFSSMLLLRFSRRWSLSVKLNSCNSILTSPKGLKRMICWEDLLLSYPYRSPRYHARCKLLQQETRSSLACLVSVNSTK